MQAFHSQQSWPSARQFTEAIQCPPVCFGDLRLKNTLPAVDRLGMPLVTSGQFAFVYKLRSLNNVDEFAVRCFRGYLGDRDQRYRAIQYHLQERPVSAISNFTYAPEGVLVDGRRYPILFMNWINGSTLDIYIDELVTRKDVMQHLSQQWLKLVSELRSAGVAHGDLQHGNIIVDQGNLHLVDHDGMFVPEMQGWGASEVGHQHFQHPYREANYFDANLDNFSALVVYLSLISLEERPDLWSEYHDENLLFTKADFLDPSTSSLFTKIREIGDEHRELAKVLEDSARKDPRDVPCLLDLVAPKSHLPAWMNEAELQNHAKTREVKINPDINRAHPRWIPKPRVEPSNIPSTPSSSSFQTIFARSPGATGPFIPGAIQDPTAIWTNAPKFAREMLSTSFVAWYWVMYLFWKIVGLDFFPALVFAVLGLAAICFGTGLYRSWRLAEATLSALKKTPGKLASSTLSVSNHASVIKQTPQSITTDDPIIGNRSLHIYHLSECVWVSHILDKNKTPFMSHHDAAVAGYKPCRVCLPAA